ncbi:hypothetical protein OHJ21_19615 [Virgibacillus sp. LDC1]|uniref:hypothetical protein n=2 Tax=Paenibacillus TaxID=44249 RepID=UPI000C26E293|nr:hypothetical protein [Paenibacillus sp. GM2FR]MCV4233395.1 hypothetical protein [Virgibacillus sp. LDC1]
MLRERQHQITVRIRVMQIGELTIHGKSHSVTPLELLPSGLVFLCPWEIPIHSNVILGYEIDDNVDHILLSGRIESRGLFYGRQLYHTEFHTDVDKKTRIVGMLNRMMFGHNESNKMSLYN